MRGALNLFQATMLRWRSRHPYNATHAARVGERLDEPRLRASLAGGLEEAGLTGYVLDAARGRYEWRGGPAEVALEVGAAGGPVDEALRAAIEGSLDQAFPRDGAYSPFRFTAIPDGDGFWLVLAYDHLVAGGDSAAALLGAMCARYRDGRPLRRLGRFPGRFRRLAARHPWRAAQAVAGLPRLAARARRARRAPGLEVRDASNRFLMASLDAPTVDGIARTAKALEATRNDVLMAALVRAVAPLKPLPKAGARRDEIGVASIVNIRSDCAGPAGTVFGQFLSSFRASYRDPAGARFDDVVRAVHAESRDVRAKRRYLRSLAAIALSGLAWRVVRDEMRDSMFGKHYPVWAGLTTLVVPGLWNAIAGAAEREPAAYRRGVSTGPLAPIVVAATFTGRTLELGVSFRPAAVADADVRAALDRFVAGLRQLT